MGIPAFKDLPKHQKGESRQGEKRARNLGWEKVGVGESTDGKNKAGFD